MKPFTPDYIRFGSRICMVTWARLIALACFLFLLAMFFGPTASGDQVGEAALALPRRETTGAVLRRAAGAVVGRLKTLAGGAAGKGKGGTAGAARVDIMRPWCALPPAASLSASQAWKPAALGTASWPAAEGDKGVACDWAGKTTTQVSFQVCTFSRDKDTQVSAYIHKEGHWSGWKKGMAEEFLPLLDSAEAWNAVEGRTLVLDVSQCKWAGPFCAKKLCCHVGARKCSALPSSSFFALTTHLSLARISTFGCVDWRKPWVLHAACGDTGVRCVCI